MRSTNLAAGYGGGMSTVRRFTSSVLAPYERGLEFGRHHPTEVATTLASYRALFGVLATEPLDVEAWGDRARRRIQQYAPVLAEEIRGIADGAGQPISEVAALNARTELLAIADPTGVDECSTVVVLSRGDAPVALQTWDWYDAMSGGWLHWTIPHPDGRVVETVTEYGVVGKIGVNSHGVGVLFNMLHNEADARDDVGFPVHVLSRHILDTAENLDVALEIAQSAPISASTSLTVVEGRPDGGRSVSIELFPGGPGVVEPDSSGLLVRTNHFLSESGSRGCLAATIGPGTRIRRDSLLQSLAEGKPREVDDILAACVTHAEVGGICAHPDESMAPLLRHATLATVVVDAAKHRLDVSARGPCAVSSSGIPDDTSFVRPAGNV